MNYTTENVVRTSQLLAEVLGKVGRLPVSIGHARAAQDACVIALDTVEDAQLVANSLGATPGRFGWSARLSGHRDAVIIEVSGRPEIHPRS